jgi:hypothetical protein
VGKCWEGLDPQQLYTGRTMPLPDGVPSIAEANAIHERTDRLSASALEKGLDVVELLATAPEGLTISEFATALGQSITPIFRMIVVMERRGWLRKDDSDRYRVSYHVLDLAFRATPAQELAHVAGPRMYALSRDSGQACHLVVG